MIQTINLHDFRQAFHNMGRGEQFSYEALELIYNYLEEIDPDFDLDVIAICCDFEEMTPQEIADSYGIEIEEGENLEGAVLCHLSHNTMVVGETSDTIVFQSF